MPKKRQHILRTLKLIKKLNHMKHFDKAVLIALLAFGTHSTLVARNTIGGVKVFQTIT